MGLRRLFVLLSFAFVLGCNSSGGLGDLDDLVDLELDPPERKPIDVSRTGVNSFFNEPQFGSISSQYEEIRGKLKLKYHRVLFAWTDGVQPSPGADRNYGFYDQIVGQIPAGSDVLIVLTHVPNWMADPANWIDGNPRKTFVERWVKPTVSRYANFPGIVGWEVWNEPNASITAPDSVLDLQLPENYIELLQLSRAAIQSLDGNALTVMAATTAINQNYPDTLFYNRRLQELGVENSTDIWNIHYYGEQFENVVRDDGVADFLGAVGRPIWVTESGEQGPNNQLSYVETVWPFLDDEIPGIARFYYYQFNSLAPADQNYGLRTTDPSFPISDLYIHLSNR